MTVPECAVLCDRDSCRRRKHNAQISNSPICFSISILSVALVEGSLLSIASREDFDTVNAVAARALASFRPVCNRHGKVTYPPGNSAELDIASGYSTAQDKRRKAMSELSRELLQLQQACEGRPKVE